MSYKFIVAEDMEAEMAATADAIRAKTGGTEALSWKAGTGFAEEIASILPGKGLIDQTVTECAIPEGVTIVRYGLFYKCESLASVTIPEGVTLIEEGAFFKCTSLSDIALPEGISTIGARAFYGCSALALTALPESVVVIGDSAFYGCIALPLAVLPSGLQQIGSWAFDRCELLEVTDIPATVTQVGSYAFYDCGSRFTTLTFHGTPEYIAANAFASCDYLRKINVPWSEGDVENAPWGAENATIVYDYNVEESDG